jgi:hypothetical protein
MPIFRGSAQPVSTIAATGHLRAANQIAEAALGGVDEALALAEAIEAILELQRRYMLF